MIIGRPLAAMMFDVQEVVWVRERSSHALESWQWFHLTRVGKVAAANNCQQHNILRNTHTQLHSALNSLHFHFPPPIH